MTPQAVDDGTWVASDVNGEDRLPQSAHDVLKRYSDGAQTFTTGDAQLVASSTQSAKPTINSAPRKHSDSFSYLSSAKPEWLQKGYPNRSINWKLGLHVEH